MNPFVIFNLPEKFDVDPISLDNRYFALQREYDLLNKDPTELNLAYSTLKNEYLRSQFLLNFQSPMITHSQLNFNELEGFLEANESVQTTQDEDELYRLYEHWSKKRKEIIRRISQSFLMQDYHQASFHTTCLKYVDNIIAAIFQKLDR